LTDVLDADRELLTAQDQLELNRADAARAAVSVFRALGGGWKVTKDPAQVRARATADSSEPIPQRTTWDEG
jgi:outer membrane protein TolC